MIHVIHTIFCMKYALVNLNNLCKFYYIQCNIIILKCILIGGEVSQSTYFVCSSVWFISLTYKPLSNRKHSTVNLNNEYSFQGILRIFTEIKIDTNGGTDRQANQA